MTSMVGQCVVGQSAMLAKSQALYRHDCEVMRITLQKPQLFTQLSLGIQDETLALTKNWAEQWRAISPLPATRPHPTHPFHLSIPSRSMTDYFNGCQQLMKINLHCVVLRLAVVLLFLPLFGLVGVVSFVDGLTQRHLRKQHGGRESNVRYTQLRRCIATVLGMAMAGYVGLPMAIAPTPWFLSWVALFGILVALTTRYYKKYL